MKTELPVTLSIGTLIVLLIQTATLFFWGGQVQESVTVMKGKWDNQDKFNERIQGEITQHEKLDRIMDRDDIIQFIKLPNS